MLVSFEGKNGFLETESLPLPRLQTKQSKIAWVDTFVGGCRSFAEVLQSKPCFKLKGRSSICMDLLQVMVRSKTGNGRVD